MNYRQSLVRKRTSVVNQLQAFARSKGLARFRLLSVKARKTLVEAAGTGTEELLVGSRLLLSDELTRQIKAVEARLEEEADKEEQVKLLLTHPGIGLINALALTHTLGDVRRFRRKEEVVAFVGLDPLEKSSGEKRKIGSISKHGSRLVRHLLGQADDPGFLTPDFFKVCPYISNLFFTFQNGRFTRILIVMTTFLGLKSICFCFRPLVIYLRPRNMQKVVERIYLSIISFFWNRHVDIEWE